MKIYDISPLIHPGIAVWPGDSPFSRREVLQVRRGDSVNLSTVQLSLHTGSHADAPYHVGDDGQSIEEMDLEAYVGRARLVSLNVNGLIQEKDVAPLLSDALERLLIRCNPDADPDHFPSSFVYFAPEAAARIGSAGVKLVGTDAPSVDPVDSKDLPAHHAFFRFRMAILENLYLQAVPDGDYELIALPLKIAGGDGSPVRAILRTAESAENKPGI